MEQTPASLPSENPLFDVNTIGAAAIGPAAPKPRTIRALTKRGVLPFFRIGHRVYYDARLVRAALELHCLVQAKKSKAGKATT